MTGTCRWFARRLLILALPLLTVLAIYVYCDPFRVLYHYDRYYGPEYVVPVNRDYASTEWYLRHPRREALDAFVFGSSRSNAFRAVAWEPLIGSDTAFHFDASGESLFGVATKVRYLDQHGRRIRHALLIVDTMLLAQTGDSEGYLLVKDPRVAGTSSLAFQSEFAKSFLAPTIFVPYLTIRLTGRVPAWMASQFQVGTGELDQIPETNDLISVGLDRAIAREGERYFAPLAALREHAPAAPPPAAPVIGREQLRLLAAICDTFRRDGTDARVVIPPVFDRVAMNAGDVADLRQLFGASRVYDYSGVNALTADVRHYYEPSHLRPCLGEAILQQIYRHDGGLPTAACGLAAGELAGGRR